MTRAIILIPLSHHTYSRFPEEPSPTTSILSNSQRYPTTHWAMGSRFSQRPQKGVTGLSDITLKIAVAPSERKYHSNGAGNRRIVTWLLHERLIGVVSCLDGAANGTCGVWPQDVATTVHSGYSTALIRCNRGVDK